MCVCTVGGWIPLYKVNEDHLETRATAAFSALLLDSFVCLASHFQLANLIVIVSSHITSFLTMLMIGNKNRFLKPRPNVIPGECESDAALAESAVRLLGSVLMTLCARRRLTNACLILCPSRRNSTSMRSGQQVMPS